ncbi:unnamed protein product [Mycena citricolor]|uniref:Uncharacterized protein n=1 Tax=Mycena citricolor TaxID=2018698 RepID=A0AAD2HHG1_9AGAR|nr:unnamed protein product [Mycena citricolor]CAK5275938.1 unnamed protein product [Mycena citricolor]CAK5277530.1 unnamed protein product [Mycena citricolor]
MLQPFRAFFNIHIERRLASKHTEIRDVWLLSKPQFRRCSPSQSCHRLSIMNVDRCIHSTLPEAFG